jgi:hypothetical protein
MGENSKRWVEISYRAQGGVGERKNGQLPPNHHATHGRQRQPLDKQPFPAMLAERITVFFRFFRSLEFIDCNMGRFANLSRIQNATIRVRHDPVEVPNPGIDI